MLRHVGNSFSTGPRCLNAYGKDDGGELKTTTRRFSFCLWRSSDAYHVSHAGELIFSAGQVRADSIDNAAFQYHINADVLRAIAYYESRLNPRAYHRNGNGTVDIGLMQINSIHLPKLRARNIDATMLRKPEVNSNVGASLLHKSIAKYGPTWRAVGAYHSHSAALGAQYARAVYHTYLTRPWAASSGGIAGSPGRELGLIIQDIQVK